ncbi:MAG: hypothetical protein NVSMB52_12780 [Chloroflexota bacterium]
MFIRPALVACAAFLVWSSTAMAASKAPPPILTVSPSSGKPHTKFTMSGIRFEGGKTVQIEMYCPTFGNKKHGYKKWLVKVDSHGKFRQRRVVPTPIGTKKASCNLYALDITKKGAFYISVHFTIT